MDDAVLKELVHWIPTPILGLGFWFLLKRTFEQHEKRFSDLVTRFEEAVKQMQSHDTLLQKLQAKVDDHAEEIRTIRDHIHDLAERVYILLGRDGSGPKPFPSPRGGR